MREIKSKAILYAFDKARLIAYSQLLDLGEYYNGEHVWDTAERIRATGIVRLVGTLFDNDGNLLQQFEVTYDEGTGDRLESKATHADEHLKADEQGQKLLAILDSLREQGHIPSP